MKYAYPSNPIIPNSATVNDSLTCSNEIITLKGLLRSPVKVNTTFTTSHTLFISLKTNLMMMIMMMVMINMCSKEHIFQIILQIGMNGFG